MIDLVAEATADEEDATAEATTGTSTTKASSVTNVNEQEWRNINQQQKVDIVLSDPSSKKRRVTFRADP